MIDLRAYVRPTFAAALFGTAALLGACSYDPPTTTTTRTERTTTAVAQPTATTTTTTTHTTQSNP